MYHRIVTIKNILLFIFLLLPSFLSANSEINDIYIGDREPITSPIPEYDPKSNSYPNPFNEDQKILTIDKDNYINFVENIRSHGIQCDLSLVVFKYNIFKEADISMKRNNINVHHLTDWEDVYNQMRFMNTFDSSILLEIRKFLDDPVSWSNYKNQITKS